MKLLEYSYLIVNVFDSLRMEDAVKRRIVIGKRLCHVYPITGKSFSVAMLRKEIGCLHAVAVCGKSAAVHAIACRQVKDPPRLEITSKSIRYIIVNMRAAC
jgi:hypothetical protein